MVHDLLCLPGSAWALQGRVLLGTEPNHRPDGQVIRCVKNVLELPGSEGSNQWLSAQWAASNGWNMSGVDHLHQLPRQ